MRFTTSTFLKAWRSSRSSARSCSVRQRSWRLRSRMPAIDATGLKAIQDLADQLHDSGRTLLICGAPSQPSKLMEQAEFHRHLGDENVLPNLAAALRRAQDVISSSP